MDRDLARPYRPALRVRAFGDNRDAVRQILAVCGRLPLAIRLIAGRLRHHRYELLADVAADFADQSAALDAFVAEHVSVRAAFEWSYRLLTDAIAELRKLLQGVTINR